MDHEGEIRHDDPKTSKKHELCVSIVPIFNHLPPEEMEMIAKATRPVSLKKGETLYRAGDTSNSLYIVHEGKIKVYRLSENGKEQLIRILAPGEFTGELAVFTESIHEVYGEAMEKTEICSIKNSDLQELLQKHPNISLKILAEFSKRLDSAEHQLTSFATEDVDKRIALYLVELAEESETAVIRLPMSRKDLASFLGTAPETISRKLTKFEEQGWIKQENRRTILILDLDALLLV
ncbi:CRP/FNR family transcriptional regulator [Planomicrobium stackebrandtii]|uniref:CRP/FNR family transcriptional regulator n=1 Tax=Planomicrobium stackebrandtii TaxID=253160 RepID=A0ABU0GPF3_9BACL|nr:Crp/Fnr family transcriptional regulator [Planomicrobium stackebrandtii]MDQ0427235.1 CRP/FNR family transcriptional regulator [Planomicrobium stackebrandtii]